jgi:hypothetical protein
MLRVRCWRLGDYYQQVGFLCALCTSMEDHIKDNPSVELPTHGRLRYR